MSKPKYRYVSYDYTFLYEKENGWWFFPTAVKVAAQTIGFDLVSPQPMNEPYGQLYWMDYNTYDDSAATTATATTYTASSSTNTSSNSWYDIYQFEKTKRERQANYFKKVNFYKKLRSRKR